MGKQNLPKITLTTAFYRKPGKQLYGSSLPVCKARTKPGLPSRLDPEISGSDPAESPRREHSGLGGARPHGDGAGGGGSLSPHRAPSGREVAGGQVLDHSPPHLHPPSKQEAAPAGAAHKDRQHRHGSRAQNRESVTERRKCARWARSVPAPVQAASSNSGLRPPPTFSNSGL